MTEPARRDSDGPPPWWGKTNPWLWALLALVVAGLIAAIVVQASRDDDDNGSGATTAATTPLPSFTSTESTESETVPTVSESTSEPTKTATATTPGGPEPAPASGSQGSTSGATLTVDGQNIIPQLGGSLTGYADRQVEGKNLKVISVVRPAVFWAGPSGAQKLLVEINLKGQPAPSLKAGQTVTFIGGMNTNNGTYGVTNAEDKALLSAQGAHAFVSVADLKTG